MTLPVTFVGDNPQQPMIGADAYIPDQLIAGNLKIVTQPIVVAAGTLQRGAVLGAQTNASIAAKPGANTGNGTISGLSLGANVQIGTYKLIATAANTFSVTSPEGVIEAVATVGTPYTGLINFTLNAGGTAFVVGDSFTVTVSEATGNYVLSVRTAGDGSQNPVGILVDFADATGGPVTAGIYVLGEFNANAISFDPSWSLAQLRALLQPLGVFLKSSVSAADPVQPY